MKIPKAGLIWMFAIGAAVLSGCAGTQKLVLSDPVGPIGPPIRSAHTDMGSLIVYSSWDRFDTLDSEHQKHTPYTILSERSEKVIRVRNRRGSFEGEPEVVNLEPGRYWVEARATNVGPIKFLAVVRAGQTTVAYLDARTEPAGAWPEGTNWIRQPNGRVVGWRDLGLTATTERASALK